MGEASEAEKAGQVAKVRRVCSHGAWWVRWVRLIRWARQVGWGDAGEMGKAGGVDTARWSGRAS